MSLTQKEEQALQKAGLIAYFEGRRAGFQASAQGLLDYLQGNFPAQSVVRPDDVAKPLLSVIEVDAGLQNYLAGRKLTQQYWFKYFTNLVLDRVWQDIY